MKKLDDEILELLRERNLDEKLLESRQLDREIERNNLIQKLAQQSKDDEEKSRRLAARRMNLEAKLRTARAEAEAASIGLDEIATDQATVGVSAQKLRGKLRSLADPRIEQALCTLRRLVDRARAGYKGRTRLVRKGIMGGTVEKETNNSIEVADAVGQIETAMRSLEDLKEQSRPADLQNQIEKNVAPCLNTVRAIVGL
ncbi:MAG: hypothetical protein WCZ98_01505 [Sideroxydans sp.]